MRDFIKMITYIKENNHNALLEKIKNQHLPCGVFCQDNFEASAPVFNDLKAYGLDIKCLFFPRQSNFPKESVGVPVHTIDAAKGNPLGLKYVIMLSGLYGQIFFDYFRQQNLPCILLHNTGTAALMYDWIMNRLPDIYDNYIELGDEESRRTYRGFVSFKATRNMMDFVYAPEPQYFLPGFLPDPGDIAIDGGAYDGAMARDFASLGAEVYSFELDDHNYPKCAAMAKAFGFTAEKMGLSDKRQTINYAYGDTGSAINEHGQFQAEVIDIDTYVAERGLRRIDYIKLDVEGAELDVLKGARRSIAKWKPKMAVSAYHKEEDIYNLLPYIKSIRPDYEFYYRHYRVDTQNYWLSDDDRQLLRHYGLDLEVTTGCETVLYCR